MVEQTPLVEESWRRGVVQFRALGEGANAENARVFGCEHIMHKQSGKSDD